MTRKIKILMVFCIVIVIAICGIITSKIVKVFMDRHEEEILLSGLEEEINGDDSLADIYQIKATAIGHAYQEIIAAYPIKKETGTLRILIFISCDDNDSIPADEFVKTAAKIRWIVQKHLDDYPKGKYSYFSGVRVIVQPESEALYSKNGAAGSNRGIWFSTDCNDTSVCEPFEETPAEEISERKSFSCLYLGSLSADSESDAGWDSTDSLELFSDCSSVYVATAYIQDFAWLEHYTDLERIFVNGTKIDSVSGEISGGERYESYLQQGCKIYASYYDENKKESYVRYKLAG